jgi:hypothetical protein
MRGYVVMTHVTEETGRKPLRAFALLAEDHHQAVERVRHVEAEGEVDVDAVWRLRSETAERLQLAPGDIWQL